MAFSQQSRRSRAGSKDAQNQSLSEELSQVTDLVERRRAQNRISQRNYREQSCTPTYTLAADRLLPGNKIRVRLENLEALVEAQSNGQPGSEPSSVAGGAGSGSARSRAGSDRGAASSARASAAPPSLVANTTGDAHDFAAVAPASASTGPCSCLAENFQFGGSDLGFLSSSADLACPQHSLAPPLHHSHHPFGAVSAAPETPPSQFGSASTPSLLGDLDEPDALGAGHRFSAPNGAPAATADPKVMEARALHTTPAGSMSFGTPGMPVGIDLDRASSSVPSGPATPAFALAGHAHGAKGPGGPACSHPAIHAPCCGQLVSPYPVPMMPMGMLPVTREKPPRH